MTKECSNCKYAFMMSAPGNPQQFIVCRRYPPTTVMLTLHNRQLATPENPTGAVQTPNGTPCPVAPNWLCGEWAQKEVLQ